MKQRPTTATLLAEKLALWSNCDGLIIAVSKEGVPLAREVAAELRLPLHVSYCTGIPDPAAPDKSIGSVSLDAAVTHALQHDLPQDYLLHQVRQIQNELRHAPGCINENAAISDRIVIIIESRIDNIDHLLATIEFVRSKRPLEIIVAAGSISYDALRSLDRMVDEVFYLDIDSHSRGIRLSSERIFMN